MSSYDPDEPIANPYTHHCNVPDVDYSLASDGQISCTKCGTTWLRTARGWQRNPSIHHQRKAK